MKAIIFGSSGQDGFYLSQLLTMKGIEAIGVSRSKAKIVGSVSDRQLVNSLLSTFQPEYVFNFAANSTTSHEALLENFDSICTGSLNILEGCRIYSPKTRIFLAGSALQLVNNNQPIDESSEFVAESPYAVSRIQSYYAGKYFRDKFGLKVTFGFFFNHDSPLRSERHVNQKIASYVKSIGKQGPSKLSLGAIQVKKEFNFAGDMVEAAWVLTNQDKNYEAVLGSGLAYSIEDWLEYCFSWASKDWRSYVDFNEAERSYDVLVSKPDRLKGMGWQPKVLFEELGHMMMSQA